MLIHEKLLTEKYEGIEITTEYKDDIFKIFSNPKSIQFTDNDLHVSISDSENLIRKYHIELLSGIAVRWGIKILGTGAIIGVTGFYHIDFKHRFATIGSLMSEQFQGKGIMPVMQKASIRWAFEKLKLHRIEGQCFVGNIHSIKNVESIGMIREGQLRQNFLINGKFEDSYIYAIVNNEY
jgi:ribosomal-protein-alanine N-acetyltransferase